MDFTLKDLELAIKIIRSFIKKYTEAKNTLVQLQYLFGLQSSYVRPEDRFFEMLMKQQQSQQQPITTIQEELTEEEKRRLEELRKKFTEKQ